MEKQADRRKAHYAAGAVGRARHLRRAMTGPEKLLWAELRKVDLHVRRQVPMGRYIADFAIHSAKLIIEVDGARHDLPENELHDALRDAWFTSQGYSTLRVRNNDILNDLNGVVALILSVALPSPWMGEGAGDGGGYGR
jgi:very-short-patch-repair endonuclease